MICKHIRQNPEDGLSRSVAASLASHVKARCLPAISRFPGSWHPERATWQVVPEFGAVMISQIVMWHLWSWSTGLICMHGERQKGRRRRGPFFSPVFFFANVNLGQNRQFGKSHHVQLQRHHAAPRPANANQKMVHFGSRRTRWYLLRLVPFEAVERYV